MVQKEETWKYKLIKLSKKKNTKKKDFSLTVRSQIVSLIALLNRVELINYPKSISSIKSLNKQKKKNWQAHIFLCCFVLNRIVANVEICMRALIGRYKFPFRRNVNWTVLDIK